VDAYSQLAAEGFLLSRHGSGTRVATVDAASAPQRAVGEPPKQFDIDFAPGSPDLGSFPRHAWLRALRQGLAEIESHAFGYRAPQGLLSARVAVADYLRRTRGVLADPRHIVLCSGATQAIALLASVLSDQTLEMEDPGFWLHRMVLRHNGIKPTPPHPREHYRGNHREGCQGAHQREGRVTHEATATQGFYLRPRGQFDTTRLSLATCARR
jgi:GntR family transcriptional regulator/MocR family aminotransferase